MLSLQCVLLTFNPILSRCYTTSQNNGKMLSPVVFVPEKWTYGNLCGVNRPLTIKVNMDLAGSLCTVELLATDRSKAS